jgi:hypothetical protein
LLKLIRVIGKRNAGDFVDGDIADDGVDSDLDDRGGHLVDYAAGWPSGILMQVDLVLQLGRDGSRQ